MISRILTVAMLCGAACAAWASEPRTADELVARAVAAMGGADIRAIRTLHYINRGPDGRITRSMAKMRPQMRVTGCVEKLCGYTDRYVEGYDGRRGWEIGPTKGRLIWTKRHAETALRCGAYLFPYFVDYQARGWKAEFGGTERLFDKPVYVLHVTPTDCQPHTYYIDKGSYRLVAERKTLPLHARGRAIDTLVVFSDFRKVSGVMLPYKADELDAATLQPIEGPGRGWDFIEANTIRDPAIFSPPPHPEPGPATRLVMEMLEASETRPAAEVLRMYREFRAANPTVELGGDLDWLGYEMLKADRYELALAAFHAEIEENPVSANAWDSLGDAYAQQGRTEEAIRAYSKAVELGSKGTAGKLEKLRKDEAGK